MLSLIKGNVAPIVISAVAGTLIGIIYLLVGLSALLVYDNLVYGIAFVIMSVFIMLAPVSLVLLYLRHYEH